MASKRNGTLYTGVTTDLQGRVWEHRNDMTPGFASKYGCKTLVWYEQQENIVTAIQREKSIKRYYRKWKLNLIEGFNPLWKDLFETCLEIDNPAPKLMRTQAGGGQRQQSGSSVSASPNRG